MIHQAVRNASEYQGYPVNVGDMNQYGLYLGIMEKFKERLDWMIEGHCKVLFIRFDLRFPSGFTTNGRNDELSNFWKNLCEKSSYRKIDIHYLWVREQSREKHQHYHCIALLDGNKVQGYYPFLINVVQTWGHTLGWDATGLVHFCDKDREGNPIENGIMITRPPMHSEGIERVERETIYQAAYANCIYWGSYLAKENQKMNAPYKVRSYGASVLR